MMVEGLLIIWVASVSQNAVMGTTRYPTIEACEAARSAVLSDTWVNRWIRQSEAHCVRVVVNKGVEHGDH